MPPWTVSTEPKSRIGTALLAASAVTVAALAAAVGLRWRSVSRQPEREALGFAKAKQSDSVAMADTRDMPERDIASKVPKQPITELLARDVLLSAVSCLAASDLAQVARVSRLFLLLVLEVQRQPSLIADVGPVEKVLSQIGSRLVATPTIGFLFGIQDLKRPEVTQKITEKLPPGCHIIGAASYELQALVPPDREGATQLQVTEDAQDISLMLGSFPEAVAQSFYITGSQCHEISVARSTADAHNLVQKYGFPTGAEWKTVVLIMSGSTLQSGRLNPEKVIGAFQRGSHETAIIGGAAGRQLLLFSRGVCNVMDGGIVGLALKGDVPLTAMVSRGCTPLTTSLRSRGARVEKWSDDDEGEAEEDQAVYIPELVQGDGSTIQPIQVAIHAQQKSQRSPLFAGIRPTASGGGYLLDQLGQANFRQGGALLVPFDSKLGWNASSLAEQSQATDDSAPSVECEVKFFQLEAEACKNDLSRLLGFVKDQCEAKEEIVLGAVMFTCGGRGLQFFKENYVDASLFKAAFPTLPLIGFWAGGEIGPQALAESAPVEATRTGRACLQGFTAVFGLFKAPVPKPRTAFIMLADADVPVEVQKSFARLAREAKERGTAAFKDQAPQEAVRHYSRAFDLAVAAGAEVLAVERSQIMSNRALMHLKVESNEAALADAEEALQLDSSNYKAQYRKVQALLQAARHEEAATYLRSLAAGGLLEPELAKLLQKAEEALRKEQ